MPLMRPMSTLRAPPDYLNCDLLEYGACVFHAALGCAANLFRLQLLSSRVGDHGISCSSLA